MDCRKECATWVIQHSVPPADVTKFFQYCLDYCNKNQSLPPAWPNILEPLPPPPKAQPLPPLPNPRVGGWASPGSWYFIILALLVLYLVMRYVKDGIWLGVVVLLGVFLSSKTSVAFVTDLVDRIRTGNFG